jgi:TPR repeat protein
MDKPRFPIAPTIVGPHLPSVTTVSPSDTLQAREWLTRAAQQGHADFQFALGIYGHGRGGTRGLRAARSWFGRTAAFGCQGARRSLARLTEPTPGRLRLRQSR